MLLMTESANQKASGQKSDLPLPLLITGVAGVAGYNAFHYFRARYGQQVIGIRPRNSWRLSGPGIVGCDMEDQADLEQLFGEHRFAAVLDGSGNCALKKCELDPTMARMMNVGGLESLLSTIGGRDVRLVRLSIDLVFAGRGRGEYTEAERTDPVTVYGRTMVEAEELLRVTRPESSILRISLPMGISFNGHAGAIDWIQSRFQKGKPATLYFDEVRTPAYTDCLNELFEAVLARPLAGLYHTGGPRRLSLYRIAQIVNRVGGYDPDLLMGIPRHEAGPIPPRAGNVAMDSTKLADALGCKPLDPWPLDERWVPDGDDWHYRRPPAEGGSPELLARVLYRNPARRGEAA